MVLLFVRVMVCSSSLCMCFLSVLLSVVFYFVPVFSVLLEIWLLRQRVYIQEQGTLECNLTEYNLNSLVLSLYLAFIFRNPSCTSVIFPIHVICNFSFYTFPPIKLLYIFLFKFIYISICCSAYFQ